jgi:hypothetical protein
MRKLFIRLVFLIALVGSLIILPSILKGNKVSAAYCCGQCCSTGYQACVDACGPRGTPGRLACVGQCNTDWQWCPNVCGD